MKTSAAILLASLVVSAAFGAQATTKKPIPPQRAPTLGHVAYCPHERQVLDFRRAPSATATPLVFHIHGGGWVNGDKANVAPSERKLAAGIPVASINCRFVTQAISAGAKPPVEWPLRDAARALQFVRSQSAAWNLDKARIGATGATGGSGARRSRIRRHARREQHSLPRHDVRRVPGRP